MSPRAETTVGTLEGAREADLLCFRGIPYAKPPIGERRFQPPAALEPWSGVRAATQFDCAAPQLDTPLMQVGPTDEDCLYLNVWTPSTTGARPVMVFLHGGAFLYGSGHQTTYQGGELSRRGDVVLVTLNYRLGALGFAPLSGLVDEACGAADNNGLRDAIAALQWVQQNIAAFGGDPGNITLFGESAGAIAIGNLLGTRHTRGLFHKVILQSGGVRFTPGASARALAEGLLSRLSLPHARARELWNVPVAELLRVQSDIGAVVKRCIRADRAWANERLFPWGPTGDSEIVADDPVAELAAGIHREVPLLVGTNAHEWRTFSHLMPAAAWGEDTTTVARLKKLYGEHAEPAIEAYRQAGGAEAESLTAIADQIAGDIAFRIPQIRMLDAQAQHQPTFMYRFDFEATLLDGALGACHALELPFVFGTLDGPFGSAFVGDAPGAHALCERMMDAWLAFARNGRPEVASLPRWPQYESSRRLTMRLDVDPEVLEAPHDAQRAFWDERL